MKQGMVMILFVLTIDRFVLTVHRVLQGQPGHQLPVLNRNVCL